MCRRPRFLVGASILPNSGGPPPSGSMHGHRRIHFVHASARALFCLVHRFHQTPPNRLRLDRCTGTDAFTSFTHQRTRSFAWCIDSTKLRRTASVWIDALPVGCENDAGNGSIDMRPLHLWRKFEVGRAHRGDRVRSICGGASSFASDKASVHLNKILIR